MKTLLVCTLWLLSSLLPVSRANAQPQLTDMADAPAASKLVGTVESGHFSGAVFDDGAGNQSFYRLRDKLPDGSQIMRIGSKSILVKPTEGEEYEMYVTGGKQSAVVPVPSARANPVRQYRTPPGAQTTDSLLPRKKRRQNRKLSGDN